MNYFRTELRRAFGWPWVAAVLIIYLPMIVENLSPLQTMIFTERENSMNIMVNALYKSSIMQLSLFALACPYTRSFLQDQSSGLIKYQIPRVGRKRYACTRFAANAISSAGAVLFAQCTFFAFCLICFPYPDIGYHKVIPTGEAMEGLLYGNPAGYYAIFLLMQIPSTMAWASLALALSGYVRNQYITLCVPFLVFSLISTLSRVKIIAPLFDACYFIYYGYYLQSEWVAKLIEYFSFFGLMLVGSFGLFYRKVIRYDGHTG
ncbi:MAG: hypothetical protein RR296_11485 [Clostridia bacterium]